MGRAVFLVGVSLLVCLSAGLGELSGQEEPDASARNPEPVFYGARICRQCHVDRYDSYMNSPHGASNDPRTPAARFECETCHTAAGKHVRGGGGRGVGGVVPFNDETTLAVKTGTCLQCHSRGYVGLWHGSMHQSRDLACTDCHRIHGGHERLLAEPSQQQLCTRCHQQIKAQILRPSHHPIREDKIRCTNCHNPHGTVTPKLIAAHSVNEKCYECHAEKRGPFVFEHPPVRESCLNCHQPHGSAHEPLLNVKRPLLCQRCHSDTLHPGFQFALGEEDARRGVSVYTQPAQLFFRSCTNCHVNIHGSNHPSGKFWHR